MNEKMKQFTDASKERVISMENRLAGVFKPVKPRKEFVHGVAHRIRTGPREAFVDRVSDWHIIGMVLAGLVSLAVFLAVAGRALVSLLGKKRTA